MKLLDKIESLGIEVNEDMLKEVLRYVEVNEDISKEEILEELDTLDDSGACHEQIDSMVDIYNYSLRQWSVDNYQWVEDAISEGLCDGTDFHKSIQAGQYLYYQDQFNTALTELVSDIDNLEE